jgi:hypothetical protein
LVRAFGAASAHWRDSAAMPNPSLIRPSDSRPVLPAVTHGRSAARTPTTQYPAVGKRGPSRGHSAVLAFPVRDRCAQTRHSDRSSKPGGRDPVAACHAAAAPRAATRRDTPAPTPNEIDQMSASPQRTPREAGFSGGSWWRLTRQRAVIALRHAAAAAAPDTNANPSHRRRRTPKSFPERAYRNHPPHTQRDMTRCT